MKHASYRFGVEWIAQNDAPGDGDDAEALAGYISVLLLADLFGVEPAKVASDVLKRRAVLFPKVSS